MENLKNYYKLLKVPSYLIGVLFLTKFALFPSTGVATTLEVGNFMLLALSLVFIGVGGYLICDIHAVGSDRVNFPEKPLADGTISLKDAYRLYMIFTSIGIALGIFVSYSIDYTNYGMLFIALAAIPYLYATGLKNTGALGNFLLASLAFISFIILGILDLMPAITEVNKVNQAMVFKILMLYGGFGFALTYIETIIANLRSLPGDRRVGVKSLAAQLGFDMAKKVAVISSIMVWVVLVFAVYKYVDNNKLLTYFAFAVMAPYIYFIIQLIYLKKETMVHQINILQNILKIVYTAGVISLVLLYYF
ncbi:MAG TPA: UbiA family prenyltransferase [Flavobacteriaceae bacterium]|nr:UbiA family prenyltransferase [Flavobacteriaceae bacterium]